MEAILNNDIEEAKYEMRKLNATDIALLASIINKIGIKEFGECFKTIEIKQDIENGKELSELGAVAMLEIAAVIISNIPKCLDDVFSFVASVCGTDVEEIKRTDLDVFAELIIAIAQKEEFKKVFNVASKLLK